MPRSPLILKERVNLAGLSWLPKLRNWLLYLIIFLSPTQLGLHFWPSSALVYGVRIDYLAPTLYFLDFLIILYLLIQNKISDLKPKGWYLNSLLPLLLINLLFSLNPASTLSWSLHFLLSFLFFLSLPPSFFRRLAPVVLGSVAVQVVLAFVQVVLGHAIQGPLYYLGERMVSVGSPNIALASFRDFIVLRAYGTFGHPNVLAGWLVISLLIMLRLKSNFYLLASTLVFTLIGVFLTHSRSAALSLFGLVIPFYFLSSLRHRLFYYVILLTASYYLLTPNYLFRNLDLSLSERQELQTVSFRSIAQWPIFGTGAQASIAAYPAVAPPLRLLQPDHNSFTLFLSWFGLVGILVILTSLKSHLSHLTSILPLLPLLLLDHYLLTSPQGLFVLFFYLALHYRHVQNYRQ